MIGVHCMILPNNLIKILCWEKTNFLKIDKNFKKELGQTDTHTHFNMKQLVLEVDNRIHWLMGDKCLECCVEKV